LKRKRFFDIEGPLYNFFNIIANVWILNLLWLLFSIPIVTMGASTTAMLHMFIKMHSKTEGRIVKGFWKSFCENFRQSTIIWLIAVAVGALLIFNLNFFADMEGSEKIIPAGICIALIIPFAITLIYVFAVQGTFVNKISGTLKYSLFLGLQKLPYTLLLAAIFAAFAFLNYNAPIVNYFSLGIGVGVVGYYAALIYYKIFKKFLPSDETDEEEDEATE
jgi:uncharacterized membrane protein YesL